MKKTYRLGLGVAAAAMVVALAGCSSSGDSTNAATTAAASAAAPQAESTAAPAASEAAPAADSKYTIDGAELTKDMYSAKVVGTLTNNTDKELSYVQVSYNLFDETGAQVGTALANTNNLAAGGTWKFEAMATVSPDKVADFKLGDVSSF